ncbi:hypothetical protein D3C76_883150 [compost metagenome]
MSALQGVFKHVDEDFAGRLSRQCIGVGDHDAAHGMLEGVAHFLLPQAVGSVEPFVPRQQQETKAITEVAAGHIQAQQQETLARREAA